MGESAALSVHVKNLPQTINESELQAKFQRFGSIRDVYMPRHRHSRLKRGYAFIEFDSQEAVASAVEEMNNTIVEGRTITCEIAKEKRKTPSEMREQAHEERDSRSRRKRSPRRTRRRHSDERDRSRERRKERRADKPSRTRRRSRSKERSRRSSRSRSRSR